MKKIKQQEGYIILLSVMIIGAISATIAVSLLSLGINSTKTSLTMQQAAQARMMANTCVDLALIEIYNNNLYTGSNTTTTSDGTCTYTVIDTGGSNRTINSSSTVGVVVRKSQVYVDSFSPINVTSWQEVADF